MRSGYKEADVVFTGCLSLVLFTRRLTLYLLAFLSLRSSYKETNVVFAGCLSLVLVTRRLTSDIFPVVCSL